MREAIDQIIYGRPLAGLALAILALELVVFVMAGLRLRRGRAPLPLKVHAIAGASILALPIFVGLSVHAARGLMLGLFLDGTGNPIERSRSLNIGIAGQLNAIPFVINAMGLALMLWFAGLAFTFSMPRPDGRARSLPPVALVGLGLLPIVFGAYQWSISLIRMLASVGGKAPNEKVVVIERALDATRARLEVFTRISAIAIPILAVVAVVLIVRRDRNRDAAASPPRQPAGRTPLVIAATALVLAALLVIAARPMASENNTPWPPPVVGDQLLVVDPPTPDVVGPDALERAPVVQVLRDQIALDGQVVDFDSLGWMLGTLRDNYRLLHPSDDFNEIALVMADPATSMPRLISVLRAIRDAQYHRPLFAFTQAEVFVRPLLGKLQRVKTSGARVRLVYADDVDDDDAAGKNAVALRPQDFPAYDAFARRLVELRREGKPVVVKLDRPRR
jgi:protein-S-isoprenylcysteine O-methyltransferase Ste14